MWELLEANVKQNNRAEREARGSSLGRCEVSVCSWQSPACRGQQSQKKRLPLNPQEVRRLINTLIPASEDVFCTPRLPEHCVALTLDLWLVALAPSHRNNLEMPWHVSILAPFSQSIEC